MNEKWLPEALCLKRDYRFLADLKLNQWAIVALLMAMLSRWLVQGDPDMTAMMRGVLGLLPLVPSLLYVRSLARWIGRMDECQRRIQLEAALVATLGTLFVVTAVSLLNIHGVVLPRLEHGLGWEGTFAVAVGIYLLGNIAVNRRYQ